MLRTIALVTLGALAASARRAGADVGDYEPGYLTYMAASSACGESVAHWQTGRATLLGALEAPDAQLPALEKAAAGEARLAAAADDGTTVATCPGEQQDAYWEQAWMYADADVQLRKSLGTYYAGDAQRRELRARAETLRRMKAAGFADRHPRMYAIWLEGRDRELSRVSARTRPRRPSPAPGARARCRRAP